MDVRETNKNILHMSGGDVNDGERDRIFSEEGG